MDFEDGMHNLLVKLEHMLQDEIAEPRDLPISLLKAITNNFFNDLQIGRGGFATVYKGRLGNRMVAMKKLSNTIGMDENKYNQEVGCLMRVKHKNIVRFLGYCADTQGKMYDYGGKFVMADARQRLLCFEYLPKGILCDYITDASCGLGWRKSYQIIKGVCEGLQYLHGKRVVHADLKPSNIILNDDMVPKIADFGLSRCFDEEQTRAITSNLAGTMGYLPPEFYNGVITFKLDIYSLGVTIAELLTGHRGYAPIEKVLESWRNRLGRSPVDTLLLEQIRVCAEISIDCMNTDPAKRPDARRIIEMLNETETIYSFNEHYNETESMGEMNGTGVPIKELGRVTRESTIYDVKKDIPLHILESNTAGFTNDHKLGSGDSGEVSKIVLKVATTCKKCKTCVLGISSKIKGIKSMTFDDEKSTLTMVGRDVDVLDVGVALRKVKHAVKVVSVSHDKVETEEKKKGMLQ